MPDDRMASDHKDDAVEGLRRSLDRPTSSDELEQLINRAIMQDIDAIMQRVTIGIAAEQKAMAELLERVKRKPA
jgi:hypothetical protein